MEIKEITPSSLERVDDKELLNLHRRCHQLYPQIKEHGGENINLEDIVNAHHLIVAEMKKRGMNHNIHDDLDRELKTSSPIALDALPEEILVVKDYANIVGSSVKQGSESEANDIDILIRSEKKDNHLLLNYENIMLPLRKAITPDKELPIHLIFNPQGAHDDYLPLYDLVLKRRRRPSLETISEIIKADRVLVELGCGDKKADGYVCIDKRPGDNVDIVHDLEEGVPFLDNSIDRIRACHVLEHLSDKDHIMKEVHRVLKPGGEFEFEVPSTKGAGAFAHPDHKSFWNKESFYFWTQDNLIEDRPKFEVKKLEEYERNGLVYVRGVLAKPLEEEHVDKEGLKPIAHFVMPKPAMKLYMSQTEAFTPDEIWSWVEKHLDNGVAAEEKLNGFRAAVQKAGGKVSIFFEDSQEERNKQLPDVVSTLEKIPADFILDANVGVEEKGKPWPRIKLMTLTADKPELPGGAYPKITVFDLVYWDEAGGDIHEKPFKDRRKLLEEFYDKYLKGVKFFNITDYIMIKDKKDLDRAWEKLGSRTLSEGIVLKDLSAPYSLSGATDALAKIKHAVEVKALILDIKSNKNSTWSFRGGLLLGDMPDIINTVKFQDEDVVDLGWSFNAPFKAEKGDIATFEVEEIILLPEKDGIKLSWLGAKPIDIDKARKEPYTAAQTIELAERGMVLQDATKRADEDEDETRSEIAQEYWATHWQESYPATGKGEFVIHHHWRGLNEEEAKNDTHDELLKTSHSVHADLRCSYNNSLWGFSIFLGDTKENREAGGSLLLKLGDGRKLQGQFKLPQPREWLTVARDKPYVSEPGGVGSTSKKWSKFFEFDHGTYEMGVWREHMFEVFLHGKKLNGRFLIEYAPVGGQRIWLIEKPSDQTPYAEKNNLEDVINELKEKKQKWLVWAHPGVKPKLINVDEVQTNEEKRLCHIHINRGDPKSR